MATNEPLGAQRSPLWNAVLVLPFLLTLVPWILWPILNDRISSGGMSEYTLLELLLIGAAGVPLCLVGLVWLLVVLVVRRRRPADAVRTALRIYLGLWSAGTIGVGVVMLAIEFGNRSQLPADGHGFMGIGAVLAAFGVVILAATMAASFFGGPDRHPETSTTAAAAIGLPETLMNRRQVASLTVAVVGLYAIATAVAELRLRPNDWVWYWYFTMDTLRAVPALVWGLVLWLMHRRLSHWLSHCRGPEEEETPRQFGSALTCQAFGLWLFTELVRELPGRVSFAVHRLDVATSAGLIGSLMLAAIASVLTFAPGRMTLFLNRHDRDEVPTTTYLVAQVLGLAGLGVILLCLRDFVFAGLVLSVSWGNVIVTIAGIAFGIRLVCGRRRWAERWLGRNQ